MKYDFRTLGWSSMKLNGRLCGGAVANENDRRFCGAHLHLQHRLSLKLLTEGTMSAIPPQPQIINPTVSLKLKSFPATDCFYSCSQSDNRPP